ncbi:hypothetical protein FRB98_001480 [Tulasnella sp. 332]|nr:hypothetical protein FRB98_001480 [Tulasnella sp. 332]
MDPEVSQIWPPKDPTAYEDRLPGPQLVGQSPFTYGNDLNPNLRLRKGNGRMQQPITTSNGDQIQTQNDFNAAEASTSSTPSRQSFSSNEYHHRLHVPSPPSDEGYGNDNDFDEESLDGRDVRVRRGSEGWEVRSMVADREQIVQRYLAERGLPDEGRLGLAPENGAKAIDPVQQPGRYKQYVPESWDSDDYGSE